MTTLLREYVNAGRSTDIGRKYKNEHILTHFYYSAFSEGRQECSATSYVTPLSDAQVKRLFEGVVPEGCHLSALGTVVQRRSATKHREEVLSVRSLRCKRLWENFLEFCFSVVNV